MFSKSWSIFNLTHKIIFDKPIVRAKIGQIRFPSDCPVCGDPATTTTRITTAPRRKQWLRPYWQIGFAPSQRQRLGLTLEEKKSFLVHVCDEHDYSDNGQWRLRSLVMLLLSLIVCLSVFVFIFNVSNVLNGYGVSPWIRTFIFFSIISLILGYYAFKPNALEKAVQIVGFDFDVQYVWLHLMNESYQDKFLKANPMNAELVNWIIKI